MATLRRGRPMAQAPALVVAGSGNPPGVTAGRDLAGAIAGARFELIGRAGACAPLDAPAEFNVHARAFKRCCCVSNRGTGQHEGLTPSAATPDSMQLTIPGIRPDL